jgi:hypothetical protein
MRRSVPVPAGDATAAWTYLLRIGWSVHEPGLAFAICPACTNQPESIDKP